MWFADRLSQSQLLIVPGAHDALSALCLQQAGAEAVYLGSYAVAASSIAKPDIGILSFGEVLEIYRRIREGTDVPLIVDADTGYGGPHNVARTVRQLGASGAAAVQIEDQVNPKRCGHVAGKSVVSLHDAVVRIEAAVEAAGNAGTSVIARTDALAVTGLDDAIDRCVRYRKSGAAATFIDAITDVDQMREVRQRVDGPLVFNAADTGVSPALSPAAVSDLGFSMMLLPVQLLYTTWQAMSRSAAALVSHPRDQVFDGTGGADFHELNRRLGLTSMSAWEDQLGLSADA